MGQNKGSEYGKFEPANKLSLDDFQKYFDAQRAQHAMEPVNVQERLVPQMRALMADAVQASFKQLNPRKIDHCFEVFGFDFMIDVDLQVWLIEVNTNPCLELCNVYLSHLVPKMLEEALQLTLDKVFPEPASVEAGRQECEGGSTDWEQIFCSDAIPQEPHCTWLESCDQHTELPRLTAATLAAKRSASSKPSVSSPSPSSKPSVSSPSPAARRRSKGIRAVATEGQQLKLQPGELTFVPPWIKLDTREAV